MDFKQRVAESQAQRAQAKEWVAAIKDSNIYTKSLFNAYYGAKKASEEISELQARIRKLQDQELEFQRNHEYLKSLQAAEYKPAQWACDNYPWAIVDRFRCGNIYATVSINTNQKLRKYKYSVTAQANCDEKTLFFKGQAKIADYSEAVELAQALKAELIETIAEKVASAEKARQEAVGFVKMAAAAINSGQVARGEIKRFLSNYAADNI